MTIDPISLSQELIRCRSVTPKDDGVLPLLAKYLEEIGFECHLLPFEEEGYERTLNLYARYGRGENNFCFAGHVDVVAPGDESLWKRPPFEGVIDGDMLYGRGAADMKCAVACFIAAIAAFLKECEQRQNCDWSQNAISLLITGDEEGIAVNGTKKVLQWMEKRGEKISACLVGEPTNPEKLGEMVKIGRRGSVNFELKIEGRQGHVAYPHNADNPITTLVNILYELKNHRLDEGNEFFDRSNLEVVNIDVGNESANVIPQSAIAQFNIRFNDSHSGDSLISWVDSICARQHSGKDGSYSLHHRISGESFITKPGRLSDMVVAAIGKVMASVNTELSTTGGTSDARFIKDYCPVIEFGLINKTAHQIDEHSKVGEIHDLAKIYQEILKGWFLK